jgi:pimeloyl-ACP methyl ester carboxylesterase
MMMKPFSVFITSDDENDDPYQEVQLQCYDFNLKKNGSPPVENILLLHCNGINCLAYKAVVEQLVVSCNCRVVTFDQRGHGMSTFTTQRKNAEEVLNEDDEDEKMWSWKTFARDAKMVLESVQREDGKRAGGWASSSAQKWHAVGHSLGGFALLWLEATNPGTFASILTYEPIFALESTKYPGMRTYAAPDASLQVNARKRKRTFKSFEDAFASYRKGFLGKVMDERSLRGYVFDGGFRKVDDSSGEEVALTCEPEIEARIYESGEEDANALQFIEERIDTAKCPITIAIGGATKKAYAYGVGKTVAERIRGARLLELGLLGHFGPLSAPEVFANAVYQNVLGIYADVNDDEEEEEEEEERENTVTRIERSRL